MLANNQNHSIIAKIFTTRLSIALIVILLASTMAGVTVLKTVRHDPISPSKSFPDLSYIAGYSLFAKKAGLGYHPPETGDDHQEGNGDGGGAPQLVNSYQINKDFNNRPSDEPAITVNPLNGTVVVGANDYGIGGPVGGGVYTHFKGAAFPGETYFPPFPFLCAGTNPDPLSTGCVFAAPPDGTGDPALGYSQKNNEFYYTSIGFAADSCASGVFLYRSTNGLTWTRPVVNRFLATPTTTGGGLRTITYWDGGASGLDCSIFNDKEWIAVDNTPSSPFYGRIYVTWSQFHLDPKGLVATSSPIQLAYSDDRGNTFSNAIDITGAAANPNCLGTIIATNVGRCVEDQFSNPVVAADGTVYVAFINDQNSLTSNRDQYLVSRVHPAGTASGFVTDGPFLAIFPVYDVRDQDYPTQTTGGQGRATLCNANFRIAAVESLAINTSNGRLYLAWADDRAQHDQFSGVTVGDRSTGYACPAGKSTDNDVFIISSSDNGATWTAPIQVNQDKAPGTINNKDQFYPWVSVNNKGQIAVLYQDRRYDNTPIPNKLTRATVSTTTDLVTWHETLIAQFASNLDNAFRAGAFIGDYNNDLITNDGTIYAAWTGVTPGKFDSDIFVAIFNISTS